MTQETKPNLSFETLRGESIAIILQEKPSDGRPCFIQILQDGKPTDDAVEIPKSLATALLACVNARFENSRGIIAVMPSDEASMEYFTWNPIKSSEGPISSHLSALFAAALFAELKGKNE